MRPTTVRALSGDPETSEPFQPGQASRDAAFHTLATRPSAVEGANESHTRGGEGSSAIVASAAASNTEA